MHSFSSALPPAGVFGLVPVFGKHRRRGRFDKHPLPLADLVFAPHGFPDKLARAVLAFGRARQTPVGHRILRLQLQAPAKTAFGLIEPEGMQQRIALIEPLLNLGVLRRDGKMCFADAGNRHGFCRGPLSKASPWWEWPCLYAATALADWAKTGMAASNKTSNSRRMVHDSPGINSAAVEPLH